MALREFKKIDSDQRELIKIQDNVKEFLNRLNPVTLDGIFLEQVQNSSGQLVDITIGTSTTLVPHGLGRAFQGWHLMDIRGDARVWRDATVTTNLDLFLPLRASASVVVKLWVF